MVSSNPTKRTRILAHSIATLLALNIAAQAADWEGAGANNFWSTPANWENGTIPFSGDNLFFGGTTRLTPENDLGVIDVNAITFQNGAGAFTLVGDGINLAGFVDNLSAVEQTIDFDSVNFFGPTTVNTGEASINFSGLVTADPATSLTKIGAGRLKFTHDGAVELAEGGGGAFTVQEGSVLFDGGATASYNVGGEIWLGVTTNQNANVTINSGALSTNSWLAVARGNGAGDVSSDLVLNGNSTITSLNFSAGYNVNNAENRPKGSVTLNDNSAMYVTGGTDLFILAESAGSDARIGLNGSSLLSHNAENSTTRIGSSGRGVIDIASPTAQVSLNRALLGSSAGGAGAIWNRGTLTVAAGASTTNFALGNAVNAYGYYLHNTSNPLAIDEAGVGGEGGGNGVMEIRSGVVTANQWLTINRTGGANSVASMLLLSGGTFIAPNTAGRMYAGQNGGADQYAHIDIGAGSKYDGAENSDMNLMFSGRAGHVANLTVHSGGRLETSRIFGGQADGNATVNFNGGVLVAESSSGTFLGTNIDNVLIHSGGATIDTKGFNPTITAPLQGPSGTVLTGIAIVDGGAGYIGRPIVKITGGGGSGATAVANFDEATGKVTGITITSPGSGYSFPPTITLVGGGATTAATLAAPTLSAATNTGALTKTGDGVLTLAAASTYGGGTTIQAGTIRLTNATGSGTGSGAVTINAGAALTGTGGTTGALQVSGTLGGTGTHAGVATVPSGGKVSPGEGVGTITVGGLVLNAGSVLDFEIADQSTSDRIVVTNSNGLTINGGAFNFYVPGTSNGFAANGVYNLIGYTGAISGTGVGALDVLNESAGKSYTFGENGGFVTLTIATEGSTANFWNVDANGNWTTGTNWSLGTAPNGVSAFASFGGGGAAITAPRTVTVDAAQTVGSLAFNSAQPYTIAGTNALTLNNGAVPASEITVTNGSHTISAPLNAVSAETQFTVSGAANSLTVSGVLSGTTDVTKLGTGTLVLNGANTYTGTTTIGGGTLEITGDASIGSSVTLNNSGTLRIRGEAATFSKPIAYELGGAPAAGIGTGANAPANFTTDIPTGSTVTVSSEINVAEGSHAKTGGGTLRITNPGTTVLGNVGGNTFNVKEGSVVLDGGDSASYSVSTGELAIGDAAGHEASLILESGQLTVATYTSVGLRNGTTGANSRLVLNGGTLNTRELFSGYSGEIVGFNTRPTIDVNGFGSVIVTNQLRLAESAGSVSTMNVSDSASVAIGGRAEIGFGGKAVLNITDSSYLSAAVFDVGFGANQAGNTAVGVVNQTGGTVQQSGSAGGDWRIGGAMNNAGPNTNDALVYGSHTVSGEATVNTDGRNYQIGAGGRGVLEVRDGGAVQSGAWVAVGRFVGSVGLMNIHSGGSFSQTGAGQQLLIGEDGTGVVNVGEDGQLIVAGNPGGAGADGGTGGIRLGHTATASGILNLNGGMVQTTGLAKTNAAAKGHVYLNGGTLVAAAPNATFMQGLDSVVAGPNHAVIDTNNFDITIGQPIRSTTGNGVTTIPVSNGGSGYLGQPIVSISGDGTGASAVANLNDNGEVVSVTITNPGINYTSAPVISLLGGGATTEAVLGTPTIGANAGGGGLIKQGEGTLTLAGANTYNGPTVIEAGTLALTGSINGSPSVTVKSGAFFDVAGASGGYTLGAAQTLRGDGFVSGPARIQGTVAPGEGIGALTFDNTLTFSNGSTLALEINSASSFDQLVAPAVTLDGQVNLSLALNYAPAPNTSWLIVSNTGFNSIAQNLFWSGPEGQLSEGESFLVNGFELRISYAGGTGNDIVLTAVPEPTSAMLLLGGLGSLAGLRRFRRRQS